MVDQETDTCLSMESSEVNTPSDIVLRSAAIGIGFAMIIGGIGAGAALYTYFLGRVFSVLENRDRETRRLAKVEGFRE